MNTLIEYTDRKPPSYSKEMIVSPTHPCRRCLTMSRPYTRPLSDTRCDYVITRCLACGFTRKTVIRIHAPDYIEEYADLRYMLRRLSTRGLSGTWSRHLNSTRHTAPEKGAE